MNNPNTNDYNVDQILNEFGVHNLFLIKSQEETSTPHLNVRITAEDARIIYESIHYGLGRFGTDERAWLLFDLFKEVESHLTTEEGCDDGGSE